MFTSKQIANYFIRVSLSTGEPLTPMKLVKLVYIAHGWHLGLYNKPLISEAVCAWKYGPVIESVYHVFKKYGSNQITAYYQDEEGKYPLPEGNVTIFLDSVWNAYKEFDGIYLSSITHMEGTPWDIVWNRQGGKHHRSILIPNNLIEKHYRELAHGQKNT